MCIYVYIYVYIYIYTCVLAFALKGNPCQMIPKAVEIPSRGATATPNAYFFTETNLDIMIWKPFSSKLYNQEGFRIFVYNTCVHV